METGYQTGYWREKVHGKQARCWEEEMENSQSRDIHIKEVGEKRGGMIWSQRESMNLTQFKQDMWQTFFLWVLNRYTLITKKEVTYAVDGLSCKRKIIPSNVFVWINQWYLLNMGRMVLSRELIILLKCMEIGRKCDSAWVREADIECHSTIDPDQTHTRTPLIFCSNRYTASQTFKCT